MWPQVALSPAAAHRWTRILCCSVMLMAGCILAVGAASLLALVMTLSVSNAFAAHFTDLIRATLACSVALVAVGAVLYVWRKCDQCAFRLYNAFDTPLLWPKVRRKWYEPPRPAHPAAERLFASYAYGVIWSKARKGVAHCPWCGHPDKLKVEYDRVQ